MACDACKELSKVWDGSQQLIVTKFTDQKSGRPKFLLVQEKYKDQEVQSVIIKEVQSVIIEVNYCPWCGERLSKGR